MLHNKFYHLIIAIIPIFYGCSAMLVGHTSDPDRKLNQSLMLMNDQCRPLPAEQLLNEAIEIYEAQRDELGLADAYRDYGFFLTHACLEKWETFFRRNGFRDKSVNFDNRFEKALEYYGKSRDLLEKHGDLRILPNVYIQMGFAYMLLNQKDAACAAFNRALEAHQKRVKKNPYVPVVLPENCSTLEDYIEAAKEQANCP